VLVYIPRLLFNAFILHGQAKQKISGKSNIVSDARGARLMMSGKGKQPSSWPEHPVMVTLHPGRGCTQQTKKSWRWSYARLSDAGKSTTGRLARMVYLLMNETAAAARVRTTDGFDMPVPCVRAQA
jgi:pantothenate kinase